MICKNQKLTYLHPQQFVSVFFLVVSLTFTHAAWKPAESRITSRWAEEVTPENVWPEYPRPQMTRENWLNLNGLWDYAIVEKGVSKPAKWDGEMLVPFPAESGHCPRMETLQEFLDRRGFRFE